jgi:hypothetical protein
MILDLGAGKINFGVVRVPGGGPTGSVGFGVDELVGAVTRKLGAGRGTELTFEGARRLFERVGLPDPGTAAEADRRLGSADEIAPSHLASVLRPYLDQVTDGLAEVIREAARAEALLEVAPELTVVGAAAAMPGLAGWISGKLDVQVRVPPGPANAVIRGLRRIEVGAADRYAWVGA